MLTKHSLQMSNCRGIPHSLTVPAEYSHTEFEGLESSINPSSKILLLPNTILQTEWDWREAATIAE